jgi:hypothetical protein
MRTKYGFIVNEIASYEIRRLCSMKKWGEILSIKTKKEIMEIRVTPSGIIKIYSHKKSSNEQQIPTRNDSY